VQTYWLRYRGTRFPVRRGEYILGRSPYCSIVVSNALSSRQHCAVRLFAQGLTITDLNSRNGTFVNGEKISAERALRAGDVVRVGSDSIEVILTEGLQIRPSHPLGGEPRHDTLDRLDIAPLLSVPTADLGTHLEDDSSTFTHNSTIDLICELVTAMDDSPDRLTKVETLRRSIDAMVEAQLHQGRCLDPDDASRLVQTIRILSKWFPDGHLDRWSDDAISALEGRR
jgi:pSer/pThr/pTyr-binding forkhead associated (FHA) protein